MGRCWKEAIMLPIIVLASTNDHSISTLNASAHDAPWSNVRQQPPQLWHADQRVQAARRGRAQRNIKWIEKRCRIPEGKDVGKPVRLRDFQKKIIRKIYNNPHGRRRAITASALMDGSTEAGPTRSHSSGHCYLTAARVRSTFHIPRVVNVTASSFDETGRYAAQCSSGAVRIC